MLRSKQAYDILVERVGNLIAVRVMASCCSRLKMMSCLMDAQHDAVGLLGWRCPCGISGDIEVAHLSQSLRVNLLDMADRLGALGYHQAASLCYRDARCPHFGR